MMVGAIGEADRFERGARAAAALPDRDAAPVGVDERQLDVLEGRGPRQQVESLEHEAHLLVADERQIVVGQLRHVAAAQHVRPGRRPIEAAEDVHERRFAGARRADDRHEFAALDVERETAERVHGHVADPVVLRQIADGNQAHDQLVCTGLAFAPSAAKL
jgi:hypothetical protein